MNRYGDFLCMYGWEMERTENPDTKGGCVKMHYLKIEHRDTEAQRFYFEYFKKVLCLCDSVFNSLLIHPYAKIEGGGIKEDG